MLTLHAVQELPNIRCQLNINNEHVISFSPFCSSQHCNVYRLLDFILITDFESGRLRQKKSSFFLDVTSGCVFPGCRGRRSSSLHNRSRTKLRFVFGEVNNAHVPGPRFHTLYKRPVWRRALVFPLCFHWALTFVCTACIRRTHLPWNAPAVYLILCFYI